MQLSGRGAVRDHVPRIGLHAGVRLRLVLLRDLHGRRLHRPLRGRSDVRDLVHGRKLHGRLRADAVV